MLNRDFGWGLCKIIKCHRKDFNLSQDKRRAETLTWRKGELNLEPPEPKEANHSPCPHTPRLTEAFLNRGY
jgi:hypothetical protein